MPAKPIVQEVVTWDTPRTASWTGSTATCSAVDAATYCPQDFPQVVTFVVIDGARDHPE